MLEECFPSYGLCERLLPGFIHMTECWCSWIQENNNISIFCSRHQDTPGLEHELTERKLLRVEAYCTKQPKLFSFQFHGTQKHYHILIMRALTEDPSLPSFSTIRWQGTKRSLEPWPKLLPIFHSPVDSNCENHHISIRCMYHQLGKCMMERMGGMEQEPCVRFFLSAGQVLRGRLWQRIQHSGHMWRWLASVEEDETPILHRLDYGAGYLCWHHNEGSSSSQQECWFCWRHGGDYQINCSVMFVPFSCLPYMYPRQHLFRVLP